MANRKINLISEMKKINTIGIIGGTGKMGQYFKLFFENKGFSVLVSGRKTKLTNQDLVKKSDLVIVSVPIDNTVKTIEEILPYLKKEQILFDLTSIKEPVLQTMLKSSCQEVIGGHPMFGPSTSIQGQIFVLTPGRGKEGLNFLKNIFKKAGAKVKIISAKKHDKIMSVVQGLTHFTDITLAHAISNTKIPLKEFLEFQSPAYRLKIIFMGRILAQSSRLYGNIQIENDLNQETLNLLQNSVQELREIVQKKDLTGFKKYFAKGASYLEDFTETSMKESDLIIEHIFQKKSTFDWKSNDSADVAVLGPKYTYSDEAADLAFKKKLKRKYCPTIREIFKNVANKKCDYGIVPVENKIAGAIHETYDSFWDFENLEAVQEMDLKINHVLVSKKEIKEIESVFSHASALKQCSKFLEKNQFKAIAVNSTTEAISEITSTKAAILSEKTAKKEHLFVLEKDISNSQNNYTRFFIIQRKNFTGKKVKKINRTILAFELLKTKAGSLLKILEFFAKENLNLLKLESKPVGDEGDTIFFVDIEGALSEEQEGELKKKVAILKVFGRVVKI